MKRLREQTKIGVRWLGCGWRLLRRNPWLLLGMGLTSIALIIVLSFIPFAGAPPTGGEDDAAGPTR